MAAAVAQERLVEVEVEVEVDDTVVSDRRPVGEEKTFRPYDPDPGVVDGAGAVGVDPGGGSGALCV